MVAGEEDGQSPPACSCWVEQWRRLVAPSCLSRKNMCKQQGGAVDYRVAEHGYSCVFLPETQAPSYCVSSCCDPRTRPGPRSSLVLLLLCSFQEIVEEEGC
jgi:hypothetical protein